MGGNQLLVPASFNRYLDFGTLDKSVRLCSIDNNKAITVFENLHVGRITCAKFADYNVLITGGEDTTICVWSLTIPKMPELEQITCIRGHQDVVTCISVSRAYSIIVSGANVIIQFLI